MQEISVTEAHERTLQGVPLVDVREQHEWDEVHVSGALLIPLGSLQERVRELPEGPLLMICHLGARSGQAAAWLAGQGRDATNVAGGMVAWTKAGLPIAQ